ncbi:MAG TPA: hypothetical protein VEJ16_04170 [Alphaproteobacteria bacterium]|nr:hypothetical protein [Alphaproteobacteria bacterium]
MPPEAMGTVRGNGGFLDVSTILSKDSEDLFILFEPDIHLVPEKGKVALCSGSIAERLDVSASGILRHAIAYNDAPTNSARALPQLVF